MGKNLMGLASLLLVTVACADTWGREGAVEIPLHRDLMGLPDEDAPCLLSDDDWKQFCGGKGPHPYCSRGCLKRPPRGQRP